MWHGSFPQGGGGWQCPLLCCEWPLEGASPGLQMDGCDICGSAGLAGPLATGAPGGFGCRARRGLGGFSEALPERSFDLLLTGPQAVLQTGTVRSDCWVGWQKVPFGTKGLLPHGPQHLAAGAGEGHLPAEVWGG